jgi:cephalosporin-C deacetylase-like acetyl esterase
MESDRRIESRYNSDYLAPIAQPGKIMVFRLANHTWRVNDMREPDSLLWLNGHRIATREAWETRRKDIGEAWRRIAGKGPAKTAPLDVEWLEEVDGGDHVRHRVRYAVEKDDRVEAWLCVPHRRPREALPAVLVLHGSWITHNWGKDAAVGRRCGPGEDQAVQLARRGYVTLAPDHVLAGPRKTPGLSTYDTTEFDRTHPEWSALGKSVWDVSRAVDFLLSLDFVDARRIGCTGISLGGMTTLLAAAFDERISAAVPVVGWSPWQGTAADRAYEAGIFYPRLKEYFAHGTPPPFDLHEIAALIAPRVLFSVNGTGDVHFPNVQAFVRANQLLQEVWSLYAAAERCGYWLFDGPHGYPPSAAAMVHGAFDRWFKPERVRNFAIHVNVQSPVEACTPCAVDIDFGQVLKAAGAADPFDPASVLMYRVDPDGRCEPIGHQLDEGFAYADKGELSWLIVRQEDRTYRVDFDVRGRGPWVREMPAPLIGHGDVLRYGHDRPGPLEVAMGAMPVAVDWAGDGRIDILSPNMYANTLGQPWFGTWFFRNIGSNGHPLYDEFVRLQVDGEYTDVRVHQAVDFNGDGLIDLIGCTYGGDEMKVLLNTGRRNRNGLPVLTAGPRFKLPEPPTQVALVDLHGTGSLHLVTGTRRLADTGDVGHIFGSFYRTRYSIHFNTAGPGEPPVFGSPEPIRLADGTILSFDGCGYIDVCDWDADGDWDLIVDENVGTRSTLRFIRNDGTRTEPRLVTAGQFGWSSPSGFSARWLDNEAYHGLLIGEGEGAIRFFERVGMGPNLPKFVDRGVLLARSPRVSVGAYSTAHVCDWDGNGGKDIVSCDEHGQVHLVQEQHPAPLTPLPPLRRGDPPRYDPEEILTLDNVALRHTWGTLFGMTGGEREVGNWHVQYVDFYGDGLPGLLVPLGVMFPVSDGGKTFQDGQIWFYPNIGTRFRPRLGSPRQVFLEDGTSDFAGHSVALGYFSGTDLLDMITMRNDGELCLYRRYHSRRGPQLAKGRPLKREDGGTLSFDYLWKVPETSGGTFLAACDWTGDGRLDLIIGSAYALFLYKNVASNAEPVFRSPRRLQRWGTDIRHSRHNLKPCVVDWDGLGRRDLLVGSESGWFHLFREPVLRQPRPMAVIGEAGKRTG